LYKILYVDDFKLAGPTANLKTGWNLLRQGLTIEPEKNQALFLGCIHEVGTFTLPGGKVATSLTYNMESFMDSCVQKYVELVGGNVRLKSVPTPFLTEDSKDGPAGRPAHRGPVVECPWCQHTCPPPKIWKDINELDSSKYKELASNKNVADPSGSTTTGTEENLGGLKEDEKDRLAPHAAAILTKCLHGARMARFDILRAITHLACSLTRWSSECDRRLHRLMCYINSTKHHA
jgi:hypothetical protein